jgi:hypothetical protein
MGLATKLLNIALNPIGFEAARRGIAEARPVSEPHDSAEPFGQRESSEPKSPPSPDMVEAIEATEGLPDEERSTRILSLLTLANNNTQAVHPLFLEEAWRRLADRPLYRAMLGAAEFGRGNFSIAEAHVEQALLKSTEPAYFHAAARCAAVLGDEARCASVLRRGIEAAPYENRLVLELASTEFRRGNIDAAQRIMDPVAALFDSMHDQAHELAEELRQAETANAMERIYGGDLYDDSFVERLWWSYYESFSRRSAWQDGTVFIGHLVRERVAELQRKVNAPAIIDFGVMTAFPNLQLAKLFPQARHFGVDRQSSIRTMNERFYQADNLSFVDGDILQFVREAPPGSILVHARTATVCYPAFVRELYRKCAEHRIGHIVVIEFAGASKHTLQFHDFAGDRTVASRSNMFFHPYRRMLAEARYETRQELRFEKQYGIGADFGLGESAVCVTASLRS